MDPINWFMTVVTQHYVDFKGRARRAEFWWFGLVWFVCAVILDILQSMFGLGKLLTELYTLLLALPVLGVSVRRLHDTGRSGWLVLIGFLPVALLHVLRIGLGLSPHDTAMVGWTLGLIAVAGVGVLLLFQAQPGLKGDNDYGPDPKAGLA